MEPNRNGVDDRTSFGFAPSARTRPDPARGTPERVLRLALDPKTQNTEQSRDHTEVKRTGQAALELVEQITEVIREQDMRAQTLTQRALEELKSAERHIKMLEARLQQAETRATEAEKWLLRLHEAMQEKLSEWQTNTKNVSGPLSAA